MCVCVYVCMKLKTRVDTMVRCKQTMASRTIYQAHVNLLKSSGFFTYHQAWHSNILHGLRFALSVLYGSQNRQRPLLHTSLTDWLLWPCWKVFTARYGLIPYIKQIFFFFKRLIKRQRKGHWGWSRYKFRNRYGWKQKSYPVWKGKWKFQ